MAEVEQEFHAVVKQVEERFQKVYDRAKVGSAKVESQMEPESVSIGWFVVLEHFGAAIGFGRQKPDIEAGDTLVVTFRKIPKRPEMPAPVDGPPGAVAEKIREPTS